MVNNTVVIPIASLSAIVVAGTIFIWWWFPRTWKKGNEQELDIMDEEQRQTGTSREERVAWAKDVLARAQAENEAAAIARAEQKANKKKGIRNTVEDLEASSPGPQARHDQPPPVTQ